MAYTVKISKATVLNTIKNATLSTDNNIFSIKDMHNLDRSLITLEELDTMSNVTVCPVGAVFRVVLPPTMTLEHAEDFIHNAVCDGAMQGPRAIRSTNAFSRLSALYEEGSIGNGSKDAILKYVSDTFPASFELTLE